MKANICKSLFVHLFSIINHFKNIKDFKLILSCVGNMSSLLCDLTLKSAST